MNELRKAAILLTCLPEEEAGLLLGRLDRDQVEAVSTEIARLGAIPAEQQEEVILEFADAGPSPSGTSRGGLSVARSLVLRALGRSGRPLVRNIERSLHSAPFEFLKHVAPEDLLTFLADEHPQTIALILSYLPAEYGARILAGLDPEEQVQVVGRIARLGQTNPAVVQEIESELARRMTGVAPRRFEIVGGISSAAEILNATQRGLERALLDALAREDASLAEEIRRRMFDFEDIVNLSDADVQVLLKNVDTMQWAVALKGGSEQLLDRILSNMPSRPRKVLLEEIEYAGAVRVADVKNTRQQIVEIVRVLEDQGLIAAEATEEGDQLIA